MGVRRGAAKPRDERKLVTPADIYEMEREKARQEEEKEWAARCGPVETRTIEKEKA